MKSVTEENLSEIDRELIRAARRVQKNAYAPYSNHKVGAAALATSGQIYVGCNVERVSLSQTTHAERNAIDTMAASGERQLVALCCSGTYSGIPCAECRQAIWEFAAGNHEVRIIGTGPNGTILVTTIGELYPHPYGPETKGVDPKRF